MASSTLTSKGQMTLPKSVRDQLRLKPGDRFNVSVQDRYIILTPAILQLKDVVGILPRPTRSLTVEEMNTAVGERFAGKRR